MQMNAKAILVLVGKIALLTVLFTVFFMLGSQLSGLTSQTSNSAPMAADPVDILTAFLLSSLAQIVVLTYIIHRSKETGWKLTGAVFLAVYGSRTVISQIESMVYLQSRIPAGMASTMLLTFGLRLTANKSAVK